MLMHGCKEGQCAACKSFVLDGEDIELDKYSTFALPDFEKDEGFTLLCRAHVYEDVVIELLNYDEDMIKSGLPLQTATAEVESIVEVTHDLRHVTLTLLEPTELRYFPGQYVDITVTDHGVTRSFSMATTPTGKPGTLEFVIKVYPDGRFSRLLAEGHLLVEDVPGVGKTMLAKAIGRSIDCSVRRVQFTPDLLPSDITGVSIFNQETRDFEFKPGGIFANIVVGDEINRASPKTQSALLESMEERQVSVDGTTYLLDAPFMVVATQNPIEMEGTYPLPEAQRDRFLVRLQMGYPTPNAELDMLDSHGSSDPLGRLSPVTDAATVRGLIRAVANVFVAPAVKHYPVSIVGATRASRDLRLGASPRASLQLLRAVRAYAALQGRDYVTPDDVQALAVPVLAHRVLLSAEAQLAHRSAEEVITRAVAEVRVPDRAPAR
jgi:MoxR-like ATPase